MTDWKIFKGNSEPHDDINRLPEPPSWRKFIGTDDVIIQEIEERWQNFCQGLEENTRDQQRGQSFRIHTDKSNDINTLINMVNAALYLRRPLLVTGKPGTGKTSLAYAVAYELKLGAVLPWYITARSTLQEGLYRYDAIARLQDVQIGDTSKDIGRYIQLGPLGTALLPSRRPRVLLIDEIDKSDINLPNDLLNLFEEGEFEIPELSRISKEVNQVEVRTYDGMDVPIKEGKVRSLNFPFILLTNNGERDFPPAFLRRCLRLNMPYEPDATALKDIVKAHLGSDVVTQDEEKINQLIEKFRTLRKSGDIATDQLLNAIYIVTRQFKPEPAEAEDLIEVLLKYLTSVEDR
ncbi:AAA family ATPase [Gloeothece verrucosa]|uniref:ATPase associated with various cellular activities AAA_5 n=1 Tax=Gloeothece verrucosa (strain PCC 7822) TaxID=497965 RepID=E0UD36_GLOV7|nr:MoxR family ATPase [Gloeothece verrucosa]ADN12916.1 ATPase associated with various cellular activities AAA_5 [Gloeothece verrucosa PCC 7822]